MRKIIPYGRQSVSKEDIAQVVRILESDFLTQGPVIAKFEKEIVDKVEASYGVAVNSATSALHVACKALGLTKGDYLWTSPITFVASANCARYCGAEVDFVDIDLSTGLISIEKLEIKLKKADKEGKLPKILVPVHLAGTSCDMNSIKKLSEKYGFFIIEDSSHAIGGYYCEVPVGSCKFSDISVFSFHPVKIITTGEGGIATTNNQSLAEKMRLLRSHGIEKKYENFEYEVEGPWSYEQQLLGFNYRMSEISAGLGLSQLKKLESFVKIRSHIHSKYQNSFEKFPIIINPIPNQVKSSHHLSFFQLEKPDKEIHKKVFNALRELNIGVQVHYTPVHLQPYYKKRGFKFGDYPNSEIFASNIISLPNYPKLSEEEFDYVISSVRQTLLNLMIIK